MDTVLVVLGYLTPVLVFILGVWGIPYLKHLQTKYKAQDGQFIQTIVATLVRAANQIYKQNEGTLKKEYVLGRVKSACEALGFKYKPEYDKYVEVALEAAVMTEKLGVVPKAPVKDDK